MRVPERYRQLLGNVTYLHPVEPLRAIADGHRYVRCLPVASDARAIIRPPTGGQSRNYLRLVKKTGPGRELKSVS